MGRSPCCDQEAGVKKGPWTPEEDKLLMDYIDKNGHGSWRRLPKLAGLNRCGKSCRLRWTNYLRPDIKRGGFTDDEEKLIIHLHSILGNKWSSIATKLPGRTDNEIKNYWNTHLRKKLLNMGIDPVTHRPRTDLNLLAALPSLAGANWDINALKLHADAANLGGGSLAAANSWDINALKLQADAAKFQLLQCLVNAITTAAAPSVDLVALLAASSGGGLSSSPNVGVDHHQQQQQQQGSSSRMQYDALLMNLPALTTVPALLPGTTSSFGAAGLLSNNGFGSAHAGDGLSSTTELGHSGASGSSMTAAAVAPPSVAAAEECNNAGGGCSGSGAAPCEETPASSPFEGLQNLNLDDLSNNSWKDLLDRQMSWFNQNEM